MRNLLTENIDKYMKTSKDNRKWCKECRQQNQQHENTCKECGIWEIDRADNRCEKCWTATLAEKRIAERKDRCVEGKCTSKGVHKFFGHSICRKRIKSIPGPLKVYAASWIKAGGDIDAIDEGLDKIFDKGEVCTKIKGNVTKTIEWFYKWEYGEEEPHGEHPVVDASCGGSSHSLALAHPAVHWGRPPKASPSDTGVLRTNTSGVARTPSSF